jgi:hypothetical protein
MINDSWHNLRRTLSLWFLSSLFINSIGIFIATVSWWLVYPVNLGTSIEFIPRDKPLISLIRAIVFGIVAGLMIGFPQQAILKPHSKLRHWIPATIIGLVVGMIIVDFTQDWTATLKPYWLETVWVSTPPALIMAFLQSLVIARAGHSPFWWLLSLGASFAFPSLGFYLGGMSILFLGGLIGAILSGLAVIATFSKTISSPNDACRTTT